MLEIILFGLEGMWELVCEPKARLPDQAFSSRGGRERKAPIE